MQSPRTRHWLFQNNPPPTTHIVRSLLSNPVLCGYEFSEEHKSAYLFPDIGELYTVLTRDGDTCLGFTHGCHAIMPLLPLVYDVTGDPALSNPSVIARRTARCRAPNAPNYFLSIDFAWLRSGALAVATMANRIPTSAVADACHIASPTGNATTTATAMATPTPTPMYDKHPFFDYGETRIFAADATTTLLAAARRLHIARSRALLRPPTEFYSMQVADLHDSADSGMPPPMPPSAMAAADALVPTEARRQGRMDVRSDADATTAGLWATFANAVATSRRTGGMDMVIRRKYVTIQNGVRLTSLYTRKALYRFLSTSGISAHGRIQRLCSQLGIQCHSPVPNIKLVDDIVHDGGPSLDDNARSPLAFSDVLEQDVVRLEVDGARRDGAPGGISGRRRGEEVQVAGEDAHLRKRRRTSPCAGAELGASSQSFETVQSMGKALGTTQGGRQKDNLGGGGELGKGNSIWKCDQCGIEIRGKKGNLNRHISNKHDKIRAHECEVKNCGRTFQTRLNLVRHIKAVHEGRPFPCPKCTRTFKYERDLSAHVATVHCQGDAQPQLTCDVCGSCFARQSTLNRHRDNVHAKPTS